MLRTVTALVMLLMAVAAASLTADRSDVDSQVARGPRRAYAPGTGKLILSVGPITQVPDTLHYTVIIQVEAVDSLPEFCCPERWTQLQLVITNILPPATFVGTWKTGNMTSPWANSGGVDPEGCKWTRVFRAGNPTLWIKQGTGFPTGQDPFVTLRVDDLEWFYRLTGCRDFTDADPGETEKRSLDEYLRAIFPDVPAGLVLNTPENPGHLLECITHFGEYKGDALYLDAKIQIFIWTEPCNIPDPPFPFRPPRVDGLF